MEEDWELSFPFKEKNHKEEQNGEMQSKWNMAARHRRVITYNAEYVKPGSPLP